MKRLLLLFSISFLFLAHGNNAIAGNTPGYNIKIKLKGLKDTTVYLANYLGKDTYLVDSARLNSKGVGVFKRDTTLGCGIYMLAIGRVKLFEFVVSETNFELETDTADYLMSMKVKDSKENDIFFEFQQHAYRASVEENTLQQVARQWAADPTRQDSVKKIQEKLKKIPQEMYEYRLDFMKRYPNAVLTQIFNSMREPEVPDAPKDENGNIIDSNWQFFWYKNHYWDNVNFESGCVLRSPVFHNKLERYIDKLTIQHPDSIYNSAVAIIDKTLANKEMFRYTLIWIMNKYEKSKYICMDAVPVRLAMRYYTKEHCFWLDTTEIMRTRSNAESFLPTLCNLFAPELRMYDSTLQRKIDKIVDEVKDEDKRANDLGFLLSREKTVNLYDINAKYTILVFWDPDCGHCKKEMPIIRDFYDTVKKYNVEVYAVGVEQETQRWIDYIRDNKMNWINVADSWNISGFRKSYNINSTPQIFLLDENKKIIAKRLGAEQLKQILYDELGLHYVAPPKKDGEDDDHEGHGH